MCKINKFSLIYTQFKKAYLKIFLYIMKFGAIEGFRAFYALRLFPRNGKIFKLRLKSTAQALFIRQKTSDTYVLENLYVYNGMSLPIRLIKLIAEDDGVVIDAGSNIGISSIIFSKYWPQKTIISIECDNENFDVLEKNVESYRNIKIMHKALWHKAARLTILNKSDASWSKSVTEKEECNDIDIPSVTLDEILLSQHASRISFIKMDIEGAEFVILKDLLSKENSIKVMLVELHDRKTPGCSELFNQFCAKNGGCVSKLGEYYLAEF